MCVYVCVRVCSVGGAEYWISDGDDYDDFVVEQFDESMYKSL